MKRVSVLMAAAACAAVLAAGCSAPTQYVDTNSSRLITNVGEINIQDFMRVSDEMTQSLIEYAGADLVGENGAKPIVAISRIVNNTSTQFDTDLLTKRIRMSLTRSGLAATSSTLNLKKGDDPMAEDSMMLEEALREDAAPLRPSYTLSGKIIQVQTKTDDLTQNTFEFQLTLSDRMGTILWEDIKDITKQGKKGTVGF